MHNRSADPKTTDLSAYEEKTYSQNGEDGIIREILERIGTDTKFAVEFGVEDGTECNTRLLKEAGWDVLQMDGRAQNSPSIKQEFITAGNINRLFRKYQVPEQLDVLCIDIDFNDFWVWRSIGSKYQPRLVIAEYNASIPPDRAETVTYDRKGMWDGTTDYCGASLLALYRLAQRKGYSLVYCDKRGVNSFFVRNDLLNDRLVAKTPAKAYRPVGYTNHVKSGRQMVTITDKMLKPRSPIEIIAAYLTSLSDSLEARAAILIKRLLNTPAWYIKRQPALSLRRLGSYWLLMLKRWAGLDHSFHPPGPSSTPIDVFMPTLEKDADMLQIAIEGLRKNCLHPIENIYIVAPDNSSKLKAIAKETKSLFVAEETVLPFKKELIDYTFSGEDRNGWIYKMLLNLFADTICTQENILILDADTLFISPQIFIYKQKPLFNLSNEYHAPYYQANERLLGMRHRLSRSFITHYMLFSSSVLKRLREDIEKQHDGTWYEGVIASIVREDASGFADYEVYGDYYREYLKLPCSLNYWSNQSMEIDSYKSLDTIIESARGKYRSISLHNYHRNEGQS